MTVFLGIVILRSILVEMRVIISSGAGWKVTLNWEDLRRNPYLFCISVITHSEVMLVKIWTQNAEEALTDAAGVEEGT